MSLSFHDYVVWVLLQYHLGAVRSGGKPDMREGTRRVCPYLSTPVDADAFSAIRAVAWTQPPSTVLCAAMWLFDFNS